MTVGTHFRDIKIIFFNFHPTFGPNQNAAESVHNQNRRLADFTSRKSTQLGRFRYKRHRFEVIRHVPAEKRLFSFETSEGGRRWRKMSAATPQKSVQERIIQVGTEERSVRHSWRKYKDGFLLTSMLLVKDGKRPLTAGKLEKVVVNEAELIEYGKKHAEEMRT